MNSSEIYRLLEIDEAGSEDEKLIMDIIYTVENYEYLKSKMNKCSCGESGLIIEGICAKCFGVNAEDSKTILFSWKW